ncbi:MAG TPA: O-antigen ligase family protein [Thermoanaerobaculia bacterium]|nr:O-antigen ligase family protein [Thermoanaerobaculia bacterium]
MSVRTLGRALGALLAAAVLFSGFPAGTRLPAFALGAAAAAFAAGFAAPGIGLAAVAFGCVVSGSAASGDGRYGPLPWPALAALSFAAGSAFRSAIRGADEGAPPPLDRSLARLGVFWAACAAVAALSARTLWAVLRGLAERAVNSRGISDSTAIRGTVLSLAAVFAGIALYDAARRVSASDRRRAVRAAAAGAAVSAAVAWLQSRGFVGASRSAYWKMIGRFPGLQSDPNAAGVLAALAIGPSVAAALHARRKAPWIAAALALAAGIAASGSRSGVLAAVISVAAVLVVDRRAPSRWRRPAVALFAAAVTAALLLASRGHGGALERVLSVFDRGTPFEYRTSSRSLFWRCAWDAFRSAPLGGIGWNAFSWKLPDLAAARGTALPVMDNPGNFYLQLLCETGLAGALLFALFVGRAARSASEAFGGDFPERGAAAALAGLVPALAVGSHLFAAEVSIAAFLMLALVADGRGERAPARRTPAAPPRLAAAAAIAVAVVGWIALLAPTAREDEAFRRSPYIGLYPPEGAGGAVFRWMRPRAALRLAPGQKKTLAFSFPDPAARPRNLTIALADRPLLSRAVSSPPVFLSFLSARDRPTVFRLAAAPSTRPSDSGGADSRLLSLQVAGAWP